MSTEDEDQSLDSASGGNVALIGEEETEVSFQVLQSIYNELTGKSEEVARRYDAPICVTLEDLTQLNHHIEQMCEPLHIQSKNLSVTVYYDEDTREIFSSFERFSIMDKSSLSPVESIVFKYNFLIVPPKSRKPQNQILTIQIASRVTILEKFRRDHMPAKVLRIGIFGLGQHTAIVTVQYVDYVMARNLLDGVERWVKGLPSKPFPRWFARMRHHSEHIGGLLKYIVLAFAAYIFVLLIPEFISTETLGLQEAIRFGIIGSLSVFGALRFGRFIGRRVEDILDSSMELSYIQLNRGDTKQIDEMRRRNKSKLVFGLLSVIGTRVHV